MDSNMGRPTKCTPELIAQAEIYRDGHWRALGDTIPSIASLAVYLGVRRETVQVWSKDEKHEHFSNIVENILALQERELLNRSLLKELDGGISKLILTKHGYSDKQDHALTSPDKSMSPQSPVVILPAKIIHDE